MLKLLFLALVSGFWGILPFARLAAQCEMTYKTRSLKRNDTLEVRFPSPCGGKLYQDDKTLYVFSPTKLLRLPIKQIGGKMTMFGYMGLLVTTGMDNCEQSAKRLGFYVDLRSDSLINACTPQWLVNGRPYHPDSIVRETDTITVITNVNSFQIEGKTSRTGCTFPCFINRTINGSVYQFTIQSIPLFKEKLYFVLRITTNRPQCDYRDERMLFKLRRL